MAKIAFIDLEASGLGSASWPIEVGWCFAEGAASALLIKPSARWAKSAWDPAAERLHGISMAELDRLGHAPADVCTALNAALAEAMVYSDAPDWDGFWLYQLFTAAGVKQRFKVCDFADLITGIEQDRLNAALAFARETAPHRHRAADDALHMRTLYLALRQST